MSSHSTCRHAQTPQARRTCREVRKVVELAERWGLTAERCETHDETRVAQVLFFNPAEPSWRRTKVVLTRGYASATMAVMIQQASVTHHERGWPVLRAWLATIANRPTGGAL